MASLLFCLYSPIFFPNTLHDIFEILAKQIQFGLIENVANFNLDV